MADEPTTTTLEGLPSAETGSAPQLRFINSTDKKDGQPLFSRYGDLAYCGSMNDFEKADIENMCAFMPPFTEEQLKALNMQNMPNSTMGELPRRINSQAATWVDFAAGNSGLWQVLFTNAPPELKDDLEEMAGECLNSTWTNFPKHSLLMLKAFKEHSKYGFGPVVWSDCYDPSPHAKMAWEMKFPARTELDMSNLTECGMPDRISLHDLYEAMKRDKRVGEDTKIAGGWNSGEIIKVMKYKATSCGETFAYEGLDSMMRAEMDGRQLWGMGKFRGSAEVETIRMWVQEYEETDDNPNLISFYTLASLDGWRIIQSRPRHYLDWSSALAAAIDSTGRDGTISGLRGLGLDIRPTCRDMDILWNGRNWAANHRMTPHYSAESQSAADAAERMVISPNGVILGAGIKEFESQVDVASGDSALNSLSNNLDRVQNVYEINAPNHKGVQRTAEESKQDAFKEQDARLSQILPMSKLFIVPLGKEFARRLLVFPRDGEGTVLRLPGWKTAKFFWDKVQSYPELYQLLPMLAPAAEITVNPNATPDGLDKKLMKSTALMEMLPMLTTQAQRDKVINDRLIAIKGHKSALALMNKTDVPMDTNNAAFIDGENADLLGGRPRRVFPDQDHFMHLGPLDPNGEGHCTAIIRELEEIQSGIQDQFSADQVQTMADRIKSGLAFKAHIDAHVMLASQNPALMDSPQMQGYYDFSTQLEALLKQTISTFQKAMEAKAAESGQQVDPKVQAIMAKTEAEINAMNQKTAAWIQTEDIRAKVKLGNQQQTADARRDIKNADFVLTKGMAVNMEKMKQQSMALDAQVRHIQEMADAQRDLNKEQKEAEKAKAQPPAGA